MRVSGGGGGVVAAAAASTAPASAGTEAECRYVDEVSRHGGRPHCGLRAILRTNPTQLCAISLRHTYVGDAGVVALMKAVPQLPNLVVMDLRENGLSNAACRSIEVGCLACRQLVLLDVSSNPLVTRKGGLHLHSLMTRSPTLLHVNVTGTLVSRYYETRLRACHKRRMDERFDASSAAARRLWEHVAATRDYSDFLQPHNRAQVLRRYGVSTSSAVAVAAAPAAPAATPQPPLVPRPPPQPPSSSAVAVLTKHNSLEVFFARGGGAASSASSAAADTRADAAGATVEEKGGVDAAAGAAAAAALWDKSERPLSLKRQHRARLELAAAAAVAAASAVAAVAALPQGSNDSDAAAAAAPPAARSAACGSAFLAGVASVTNMPHDEVWTLAPRSEDECRSATTSPAPLAPPAAAAPALAPHPPSAPPPQGRVSHYTSADFEGAGEEGMLQRQQQQQALAASAGSSGTEATEEEEEEEGVLLSEDDDDDDDDDEATTTTTEGECSSDGRSSSSSQGAHRAQHSSSLAPGPMLLRGDPNTPLFRTTESDLSCAHGESLISDLYCASGGDASVAAATATTTTTTSTAAPSVAAASGGGTSTSTSTSTAPPRRPSVPPATPGLLAELGELGAAAQLRKEQQQQQAAGHSPCWKPPSDEVAGLFSYIAAYKPTEQAIDTPFKFPGKLSYIPAVGAPDACLQPAPPADIPSPPEAAVGSSCMFWTYMMTADPAALADKGGGGAAAAATAADRQPPNPHDNPEAALQALQRRIYYANIAPPAVYDQPIASLMEEAGPPLPAFPFLGSEDGEAAATATAVGSEVEDEAAAVATTPDAAAASAAAAAAAAETPANGAEAGGGAKVEAAAAEEAAVVEAEEEDEDDDDDDEPAVPLAQFDGWHLASDLRCFNTVSAVSAVRRCAPSDAAEVPAAAADGEEGTTGRLVCRDPAREMTAEELSRDALERYLTAASLQINTVRPYASGEQTPDYKGAYHLHAVVRASSGGLSRAARLTSGALNKTGSRLATGSYDLTAKIWDAESGGLLKSLVGHEGYVYDVIWNVPFCDRLVTASFDRTCKVWEASTGECLHTLVGHEQEVVCICINGESTLIASGSMDTTVIVWNALSGTQIAMLQGHTAEIVCVDFSPTNEMLVSGSADETMRVWHALTGELVAVLAGHHGEVSAVRFNVHGNLILSCSSDTTCRLWDVATRKAKSLKGHSKDVSDCDFSSDGWLVASGSEDMSARVWDTLSGGCISMMKGHTAGICCVSFGASGRELLTGSADMTCRRWRVSTGECLQVLAGHRGVVISSYCLDNSTVLTISKDNTCRLWRRDPPNRSLVQYVMQFVCLKPVMKAQLLQDPRVPQHLKKLAREVEERLADVIAPAVVPTVLYHH